MAYYLDRDRFFIAHRFSNGGWAICSETPEENEILSEAMRRVGGWGSGSWAMGGPNKNTQPVIDLLKKEGAKIKLISEKSYRKKRTKSLPYWIKS